MQEVTHKLKEVAVEKKKAEPSKKKKEEEEELAALEREENEKEDLRRAAVSCLARRRPIADTHDAMRLRTSDARWSCTCLHFLGSPRRALARSVLGLRQRCRTLQ